MTDPAIAALRRAETQRLLADLEQIALDPASLQDRQRMVQRTVERLFWFVRNIGEPAKHEPIIHALHDLMLAFGNAALGLPTDLFEKTPTVKGRSTPLGESIWKQNVAALIEYLRTRGLTLPEAASALSMNLASDGADVPATLVTSIYKNERAARKKRAPVQITISILDDEHAGRLASYLARTAGFLKTTARKGRR